MQLWKSRNRCYDGQIKHFVASFLYRKYLNGWWCRGWQMISHSRSYSDGWRWVFIVLMNSLMTLETLITSWPGSIPFENGSLVKHSVESRRSVVTNDDVETTFLLNVLWRIVARELALDSFDNLCCLVRDCEGVGTRSNNMFSFCKHPESSRLSTPKIRDVISETVMAWININWEHMSCPTIFFQEIHMIYFKTAISQDLPGLK